MSDGLLEALGIALAILVVPLGGLLAFTWWCSRYRDEAGDEASILIAGPALGAAGHALPVAAPGAGSSLSGMTAVMDVSSLNYAAGVRAPAADFREAR